MFAGVDLIDLSRGEGEWRNLQEIVRKALRVSFESAQKQQETINRLEIAVASLKNELSEKATMEDVKIAIDTKLSAQGRYASASETAVLKAQLANIKSDVDRKATIRYVDESLKRKLNKSDAAIPHQSDIPIDSCLQDILAMKTKLLTLERSMQGLNAHMEKFATKNEMSALSRSIQDICDMSSGKADRVEIQSLLSMKLGINDADQLFRVKADRASVEKSLNSLENILAVHEREITSLVLHGGSTIRDGSGSSGVGLSLAQGLVSSSKARGSLHHQSMETGEDGVWSEGEGVGRMGRLLVAGREEAHKLATSSLLETTSVKLDALQRKIDGSLESRLKALESGLTEQRETLHLHEDCIQQNTMEIRKIDELSISLEATNVQVLELREQHGTPLTVPLSSVLIELEGRISELDQLVQAEIVMTGENRVNQVRDDKHLEEGILCRLQLVEQELSHVSKYKDSVEDYRRDFDVLRHSILMIQDMLKQPINTTDIHSLKMSFEKENEWFSAYQRLREKIDKLESFCSISGSRTIHTVQDVVNAVRLLRRSLLVAEDKINDVTSEVSNHAGMLHAQQKSMTKSERDNIKRRLQENAQRLESCEVIDQVHQVRLDAIEDSLNKIESRYRNQLYAYRSADNDESKSIDSHPNATQDWMKTTMLSSRAMGQLESEDSISSHEPPSSSGMRPREASRRIRAVRKSQARPSFAAFEGEKDGNASSSSSQVSSHEEQPLTAEESEETHRWFRAKA